MDKDLHLKVYIEIITQKLQILIENAAQVWKATFGHITMVILRGINTLIGLMNSIK